MLSLKLYSSSKFLHKPILHSLQVCNYDNSNNINNNYFLYKNNNTNNISKNHDQNLTKQLQQHKQHKQKHKQQLQLKQQKTITTTTAVYLPHYICQNITILKSKSPHKTQGHFKKGNKYTPTQVHKYEEIIICNI